MVKIDEKQIASRQLLQARCFKKGNNYDEHFNYLFFPIFPRKFNDLVVRISPFNLRVHGLILFSIFFFFFHGGNR
jgi:hypothetical protein